MRALLCSALFLFACSETLPETETHVHVARHDGIMRSSVGNHKHLELYINRGGRVEVFLNDEAGNPVAAKGATGTIEWQRPDGAKQTFPLVYEDEQKYDLLTANLPPNFGTQVRIIVDAVKDGANYKALFDYDLNKLPDRQPHMHDPRQGGQVAMLGDQHVELVRPAPGEYRVFLSDLSRGPLPPSLAKSPSIVVDPDAESPEMIPLTIDPTQTFLQASGSKNPKDPLSIRVNLTLNEKPGLIDFLWTNPKAGQER